MITSYINYNTFDVFAGMFLAACLFIITRIFRPNRFSTQNNISIVEGPKIIIKKKKRKIFHCVSRVIIGSVLVFNKHQQNDTIPKNNVSKAPQKGAR